MRFSQNARGPGVLENVNTNVPPSNQVEAENIQNLYNPPPSIPMSPPSGAEEVQGFIKREMPSP